MSRAVGIPNGSQWQEMALLVFRMKTELQRGWGREELTCMPLENSVATPHCKAPEEETHTQMLYSHQELCFAQQRGQEVLKLLRFIQDRANT